MKTAVIWFFDHISGIRNIKINISTQEFIALYWMIDGTNTWISQNRFRFPFKHDRSVITANLYWWGWAQILFITVTTVKSVSVVECLLQSILQPAVALEVGIYCQSQSLPTLFATCYSMSPIYYNNYVRLQLLWWRCWCNLTPITTKTFVICLPQNCASRCFRWLWSIWRVWKCGLDPTNKHNWCW